jgi:hypothetical protein
MYRYTVCNRTICVVVVVQPLSDIFVTVGDIFVAFSASQHIAGRGGAVSATERSRACRPFPHRGA